MSREIKFRAWDKSDERFISTDWKYGAFSFWSLIHQDFNNEYSDIQQYTGLKDKNGVEIYEGDIVRHVRYFNGHVDHYGDPISEPAECTRLGHVTITTGKGVVINGRQIIDEDCGKIIERKYNENPGLWCDLAEVIGNIHENPELLEKV